MSILVYVDNVLNKYINKKNPFLFLVKSSGSKSIESNYPPNYFF